MARVALSFTLVIGQVRATARVPSSPVTRSDWWARSVVPAASAATAKRSITFPVSCPLSSPSPSCARRRDRTASGTGHSDTDRGTAARETGSTAIQRTRVTGQRASAVGLGNPSHRCRRTR